MDCIFGKPSLNLKLISLPEMPPRSQTEDDIRGKCIPNRVLPSGHVRIKAYFEICHQLLNSNEKLS